MNLRKTVQLTLVCEIQHHVQVVGVVVVVFYLFREEEFDDYFEDMFL